MPKALPRETFIALRARRQAYQIASSIRDPRVLPETDEPNLVDPEDVIGCETQQRWKFSHADMIVLLVVLDVLNFVAGMALWLT